MCRYYQKLKNKHFTILQDTVCAVFSCGKRIKIKFILDIQGSGFIAHIVIKISVEKIN